MNEVAGLLPDGSHQIRMAMSQNIHGDSGHAIEIFPTLRIIDLAPPTPHNGERYAAVSIHQIAGGVSFNFFSEHTGESPRQYRGI